MVSALVIQKATVTSGTLDAACRKAACGRSCFTSSMGESESPSEAAPLTAEVWAGLACRVGVILVAWLHR